MKYTFVNSVKGGCGKTTASLMWALQKADYDIPTACIVDLDILGTAFESIVADRCFVKSEKKDFDDIPVLDAAEIYLNDLCRNTINLKQKYISKLKFGDYRTDVILASPDFKDKSLFIPNYNNQYMAGVSYDYFKSIARRFLKELKDYQFPIHSYDGEEYKQEMEKTYKAYKTYYSLLEDAKEDVSLEDTDVKRAEMESLEQMEACLKGIDQKIQELDGAKNIIPIIIEQCQNVEYKNQCSWIDEHYYDRGSAHAGSKIQKFSKIIDKASKLINYAGVRVSNYSEIVFDMPPNSEPYSDIFLEMVLEGKVDCTDGITFIIVSSLNRAHIDANKRWLKDFLTRAASQKWKMPQEIIFVFNDSGDLLSKEVVQTNGDLSSSNDKKTDAYKTYRDVFDERLPEISEEIENMMKKINDIKVAYYQLDYMKNYADTMLSREGLMSIELEMLHEYRPQRK